MEYDKTKYKIKTWQNWANIHWMINPGVAVGELIFGIRVPGVTLIDTTSDKPLMERQFIPCPHCSNLNDARIWWSSNNKTYSKNWFGLYCPVCGKIIPCLFNLTSLLIIVLTFPFWIWFYKPLKRSWLEKQPKRYENITYKLPKFNEVSWIKMGLKWGAFMFLIMSIIMPLIDGKKLKLSEIGFGIVIWTLGGLGFGYWMKKWNGHKRKKMMSKGENSETQNK
jgi:hypothetical protein